MNAGSTSQAGNGDTPLNEFSNCHAGILKHLADLGDLPALLAPAERARRIAAETLQFFRSAIFEHHAEEEQELFPVVVASAKAGEERERVKAMTARLTQEHRAVEALWVKLEPELKHVAKGQSSKLDGTELERLVATYGAHAAFEERDFLPLAKEILGRDKNDMAALGMSLHMRHHAPVYNPYV